MAGRIPQSFIDELTARADIVELIGSRVELKKAGREYRACCPFHNEKTPSFWVSPQKQFYHCFGCGAHGTALGFLMEYDKLSFPEAIEELAGRLGLDVPREASSQPDNTGSTQPLYDLNLKVAKYFARCLARRCARQGVREEARPDARDRRALHDRLRAEFLERSAQALRLHRRRPQGAVRLRPGHRARTHRLAHAGSLLRPLSRPADVPHPRFARPRAGLRRPHHRPGRTQVPELARDPAVPQGPRALRPVRGAPEPHHPETADGGRGLHGRGAAAPGRRDLRRGHARHRHHARSICAASSSW